ncbi:MAG: competence/damage-inducible protein A [Devosiaceae bacterium]
MSATASMLVIGDEILSGKTKDKNIGVLADALTMVGIDLVEVRIVTDEEAAIVSALNALRASTTYVFTSGGIGPTHDDITADSVAKAFGVGIDIDPRAHKLLSDFYASTNRQMNAARERMTRVPHGADLIDNAVSIAPGFRLDNVHVMAGVPSVFSAMLESVLPTLKGGVPIAVQTLPFKCGEGDLAEPLAAIDAAYPSVAIGSYPKLVDGKFTTEIVLRSRDQQALDAATLEAQKLRTLMNAA